jgi:hypothetical protein
VRQRQDKEHKQCGHTGGGHDRPACTQDPALMNRKRSAANAVPLRPRRNSRGKGVCGIPAAELRIGAAEFTDRSGDLRVGGHGSFDRLFFRRLGLARKVPFKQQW